MIIWLIFSFRCSKTITVIIITKMRRNQRKSRLKITKCLTDIPTNISTTTTNTTKATRPTSATKSRDTRATGDGGRPGRKRRKLTKSPAKAWRKVISVKPWAEDVWRKNHRAFLLLEWYNFLTSLRYLFLFFCYRFGILQTDAVKSGESQVCQKKEAKTETHSMQVNPNERQYKTSKTKQTPIPDQTNTKQTPM